MSAFSRHDGRRSYTIAFIIIIIIILASMNISIFPS